MLAREKRMRPARRGDQRHPPRALLGDPSACRSQIKTAPWGRGGGIELVLGRELAQTAHTSLLSDHPAAIAVHLERDHRIGESLSVVVEKQERVEEGVAE